MVFGWENIVLAQLLVKTWHDNTLQTPPLTLQVSWSEFVELLEATDDDLNQVGGRHERGWCCTASAFSLALRP